MKRVVVLISGRGSNLQALIDAQNDEWEIVGVLSDNPDARGLRLAHRANIPGCYARTCHVDPVWILAFKPDLVVLAGFMRILKPRVLKYIKAINVHPSLLPKYKGLNTHQRVLDAGETEHGATVHWVDEGLDTGVIIEQVVVPVMEGDNAEVLAARVLEQEHKLLVKVVSRLLSAP